MHARAHSCDCKTRSHKRQGCPLTRATLTLCDGLAPLPDVTRAHLIERRYVQDVLRAGLAVEGDECADVYLIVCRKQPGMVYLTHCRRVF